MTALAVAAALALPLAGGCRTPDRTERPLQIRVQAASPAAVVTARAGDGTPVALGRGPVVIDGLTIVRKRFLSGEVDYWLRDDRHALPPNPAKPAYASGEYIAGADYPLVLTFAAAGGAGGEASGAVRIDRDTLAKLYAEREPAIQLELRPGRSIPR